MEIQTGSRMHVTGAAVLACAVLCALSLASAAVAHGGPRARLLFTANSSVRGANHLLLRRSGPLVQLVDTDTHTIVRESVYALTSGVSITGASGRVDNTLTLDFSRGPLAMANGIHFDGGTGGYNTLDLRGGHFAHAQHTATGPHSGLMALDGTRISYAEIAPISDTVPAASYTLNVSAASINVNVVDGPEVLGAKTTQINDGGSSSFELTNIANKKSVTVHAMLGGDTITLNNPHPGAGMESIALTGAAEETPTEVHTVFNVIGLAVPLTVQGGGYDTANIGAGSLAGILAPVGITDPTSFIALNVDDSADATGRAAHVASEGATDTILGLGPAPITANVSDLASLALSAGTGNNAITFAGAGESVPATLNTGAGSDAVNVQATAGPLAVHGQNGRDTLTVGLAGSVQGIRAPVSIDNALGSTALTLDDSADGHARSATVNSSTVNGLAPAAVSYANVPSLTVKGAAGGTAFTVAPSAATTDSIAGGGASAGNALTMNLSGTASASLAASAAGTGVNGAWTFANRGPVNFSGMHSLNPTALSIADAATTIGSSGITPLSFTASLLAPSTQAITAGYSSADGSATASSGAYQAASGTIGFAPGTTTQTITLSALGNPFGRPTETVLLHLSSPTGAVIARGTATGSISSAPPLISNARESHRSWRAGRAVARFSALAARAPLGTVFSFTSSEWATATLLFTEQLAGRSVGGRCVAPTHVNRRRASCLRSVSKGALTHGARPGTNRVSFQGRLSRARALGPGRYTLLISATNLAGAHSSQQRLNFTITR